MTSKVKSNTPRTDEAMYPVWSHENYGMGEKYADHVVDVDFARDLERGLNLALAEIERLTPAVSTLRAHFFRPKGFNHGVYEVEYNGDEKPTARDVIDAAMRFAVSDRIYFTISQRMVDHQWESWRRNGHCQFSLCVMRYDGRSYLHG